MICLLITTMNRSGLLRNSLRRLAQLTLPDEVLVVDDGGADACEQVCAEFTDTLPIRYLYHHNPQPTICSFARNVGIKHTDADVLITAEPEVVFLTDVVAQVRQRVAEYPGDVISAGVVYHAQGDGVLDPAACQRIDGWVAPFIGAYERRWLLDVGGWDEGFPGGWGWDDTDLLTRLRHAGHGQVIAPDIQILHQWHAPSPHRHQQHINEAYFRAKLGPDGNMTDAGVLANGGKEWGCLTPRP